MESRLSNDVGTPRGATVEQIRAHLLHPDWPKESQSFHASVGDCFRDQDKGARRQPSLLKRERTIYPGAMVKTRRLLRREITYASTKEEEVNILYQLGYHNKQTRFFTHLYNNSDWIKTIITHNLNLSSAAIYYISKVKD